VWSLARSSSRLLDGLPASLILGGGEDTGEGRLPGQLELGQASFRTSDLQLFVELANCRQLAIGLHVQDGL
jgi:hypothetical protein